MKKILIPLLAAALALFAVEWEKTQITDDPTKRSGEAMIAFDTDGKPLIVFEQDDGEHERIAEGECSYPAISVDTENHLHLAYIDYYEPEESIRINYLTNKSGRWEREVVFSDDVLYVDNFSPCIALDTAGNPYVAFARPNPYEWYDIYYACRTETGWAVENVTSTPSADEMPGTSHYFTIEEGYAHLVYSALDSNWIEQIYYLKSELSPGISEEEPSCNMIEIKGFTVWFTLIQTATINLNLYDAAGRLVESLAEGTYPEGQHSITINPTGLSAGVYFVRLEAGAQTATGKILNLRWR